MATVFVLFSVCSVLRYETSEAYVDAPVSGSVSPWLRSTVTSRLARSSSDRIAEADASTSSSAVRNGRLSMLRSKTMTRCLRGLPTGFDAR